MLPSRRVGRGVGALKLGEACVRRVACLVEEDLAAGDGDVEEEVEVGDGAVPPRRLPLGRRPPAPAIASLHRGRAVAGRSVG